LLKQRLNLYVGIFNGLGAISKNNDASGSLSWMARADFSYPSRFRYNEIDLHNIPIPLFSIGASINGLKKAQDIVLDNEYILGLNGKKMNYGADFAFQFKGLSVQAEWFYSRMSPNDTLSVLLEAKPTKYIQAGGFIVAVNYHIKAIKTALCLRYDYLNPNDLRLADTQKSISFAAIHFIKGQNLCLRAEYHHRLNNWKDDDLRISM